MGDRGHSRFEIVDGLAVLYMDRPPVNAITIELLEDFTEDLEELEKRDDVRSVVITGAGPCFSAGLDLHIIPGYDDSQRRKLVNCLNGLLGYLYGFPKPVIAAVNGHAIAGGFFPLIASDWRVCIESGCGLGLTEARMGLTFPLSCMELVWAELTGRTSRHLFLTGRVFEPGQALAMGIVDELQPAGKVLKRALEVADELGNLPPGGFGRLKRQLREGPLARIEAVVKDGNDPQMNAAWMTDEARAAAEGILRRD